MLAKAHAVNQGFLPQGKLLTKFWKIFKIEKGILVGFIFTISGLSLLSFVLFQWFDINLSKLDNKTTTDILIPALTLTVIGFQTILFSFFASILGLKKKK